MKFLELLKEERNPIQDDMDHIVGNKIGPALMSIQSVMEAIEDKKIDGPVSDFPGSSSMLELLKNAERTLKTFMEDYKEVTNKHFKK
jgi:hypothetical protein